MFGRGYEYKYIISKNRYASYIYDKVSIYRYLEFYKKHHRHRQCNIGPQYIGKDIIEYVENDEYHNLYGYALIKKGYDIYVYYINGIKYNKVEFNNYLDIYNNISYKRTY